MRRVNSAVLDASAILAVLHMERGHDEVMPFLRGGLVSAVNYSEVLKKVIERGGALPRARAILASFALVIVPFDERLAARTAELWPAGKPLGLSLADRACLALGMERGLAVLTAESKWAKADLPVVVKLIR
jgi:ribonuclease VapC